MQGMVGMQDNKWNKEITAKGRLGQQGMGWQVRVFWMAEICLLVIALLINDSHSREYLRSCSVKWDHAKGEIPLIGANSNLFGQ